MKKLTILVLSIALFLTVNYSACSTDIDTAKSANKSSPPEKSILYKRIFFNIQITNF